MGWLLGGSVMSLVGNDVVGELLGPSVGRPPHHPQVLRQFAPMNRKN